jgi:hypothetical protein
MALATTLVFGTLLAVIVAVVISGRGDADQSTTEGPTPTSALGPVTSSSMTSTVPGSAPASAFPAPATGGVPTAPPTPVASTEPEPPTTVGSASSAPPTIPPTTPPTTLPTVGDLSQAEAEGILRDFYAAVEAGDYETTWRQLSPEFQRGKARSFQYYTSFWDENDIEVGRIELVEATARQAIIDADLRWNGSDSWQTERFTLQSDGDAWLIAEQTTLSR